VTVFRKIFTYEISYKKSPVGAEFFNAKGRTDRMTDRQAEGLRDSQKDER
jgi:hypothetical protein